MIFNCDEVTRLVMEWQSSKDVLLMSQILEKSRVLIEVLVSSYDPDHREDLIQESYAKIQYASQYYDPQVSNLHNYFTTVIRNVCSTYIHKANREIPVDPDDLQSYEDHHVYAQDLDILQDLTIRNRNRFPSIPVDTLDDITEMLYYQLVDGKGSTRGIVALLMATFDVTRTIATIVCNSSLIYMRCTFRTFADVGDCKVEELSLISDLRDIIGDELYSRVSLAFSKMHMRFP
jgi:hypothetical protein